MNNKAIPSLDLIKKYDLSQPRYPTYSSPPNMVSGFSAKQYQTEVRLSNEALLPKDLSLYLHMPFCHSLCYFCGSNKVITNRQNHIVRSYFDNLAVNIGLQSKLFDKDRQVTKIHFGGGTPNYTSISVLAELLDQLSSYFHFSVPSKMCIGIEIDPRFATTDDIEQLAHAGFNHFNIGIQDFCPDVQKAVNRIQSESKTIEIINTAKTVCNSVNVDLIVGLPKQTLRSFEYTLEKIVEQDVDRIAAYNFSYLPTRIRAQRLIEPSDLPSTKLLIALNHLTHQSLISSGYNHIGLDQYAKPNNALSRALNDGSIHRDFQGFSSNGNTDLIGIGAAAISNVRECYIQNATDLSEYQTKIEMLELPIHKGLMLNKIEKIRSYITQEIICRGRIDLNTAISSITKTSEAQTLANYFTDLLPSLRLLQDNGLLGFSGSVIEISKIGRFFLRQIVSEFDIHLNKLNSSGEVIQFSRAI